uniref:(California timema) hypothetical protein n=1 Tax=Timema californicum TaxID=61474 RepID=A0A7R9P4A9_TIMCA|nr:unnamed protein product [Timema californicum]
MASEENNVPVESKELEQTQNDSNKQPQEEKPSEEATAETTETPATQTAAQPPKPTVHKQNFEKDIIYLYQFSRTPVLPSLSPFCLKVETWLRLAALKYERTHLIAPRACGEGGILSWPRVETIFVPHLFVGEINLGSPPWWRRPYRVLLSFCSALRLVRAVIKMCACPNSVPRKKVGLMSIGPTLILAETVEEPGSSSIDGEPEVHGVYW